jgi:hypothetical protein
MASYEYVSIMAVPSVNGSGTSTPSRCMLLTLTSTLV